MKLPFCTLSHGVNLSERETRQRWADLGDENGTLEALV